MPVSPAQPSSVYKPDKFIGLLPAGASGTPTSFVGAYLYDASTGQAVSIPRIVAASAVAVPHTGDTNETVLGTVAIPAGAMGANGILRVTVLWSMTGTNSKTARVRLGGIGGTAFLAAPVTTTLSLHNEVLIRNRNDAASQVTYFLSNSSSYGANGNANTTGTVDTSAAQDLVFTGALTSAGESITLESYLVELLRA